jgi:RimJ/RimL family protein N-acetyltransferase
MVDIQTLNGTRVRLRPPRLDDADVLFERIASDPEVTRYMSWPTHPDVGETRKVITQGHHVRSGSDS